MDIYKQKFTTLELEIISFLSIRAGEKFSQREVAKELDVSPTAVGNSIKRLNKEEVVKLEKIKNINLISYNRENQASSQLKRSNNLKNIYVSGLANFLEESLAGSTIILFGSFSKGEDTKNSDIDIAVIDRKEKKLNLDKFEIMLRRKININYYESWKDIHKNLKNNILNGIVLQGSVDI